MSVSTFRELIKNYWSVYQEKLGKHAARLSRSTVILSFCSKSNYNLFHTGKNRYEQTPKGSNKISLRNHLHAKFEIYIFQHNMLTNVNVVSVSKC
jgi:hypothetical protein